MASIYEQDYKTQDPERLNELSKGEVADFQSFYDWATNLDNELIELDNKSATLNGFLNGHFVDIIVDRRTEDGLIKSGIVVKLPHEHKKYVWGGNGLNMYIPGLLDGKPRGFRLTTYRNEEANNIMSEIRENFLEVSYTLSTEKPPELMD